MTSLDVERWFPIMRAVWPVPYVLQYYQERKRAINENTKKLTTKSFSYHTGTAHKDEHYKTSGAVPFKAPKVTPRPSRQQGQADGILHP